MKKVVKTGLKSLTLMGVLEHFGTVLEDTAGVVYDAVVPTNTVSACVRVFGQRYTPKQALADTAIRIALGRFRGFWAIGGNQVTTKAFMTTTIGDEDVPFVELRCEFWSPDVKLMFMLSPEQLYFAMDLSSEITGAFRSSPPLPFAFDAPRPQIGPDNVRGSWMVALAQQILSYPCSLPAVPVTPTVGPDADRYA